MTMGPSIHHELILALDQTDLNGGFSLAEEVLPWITDVVGPQVGPGGALVGPGSSCLWALGLLPRPLGPFVHICHLFDQNLPYFLHTNNSPSTSGSR